MKRYLLCVVLLLVSVLPAFSDSTADLPNLKTKVKTVAVFKNGLGFVYRSGETQVKDGWAKMDAIPQAALGTLWFGSKDINNPIEQVISLNEDAKKDYPALNFIDLLKANIGKYVNITFGNYGAESKIMFGKILSVPEYNINDEPGFITDRSAGYYPRSQPQMILLENADKSNPNKIIAISPNQITSISFNDTDFKAGNSYKYKSPSAKIRMKNKAGKADVSLAYLEKGLTWSPGYLLDIQNPKIADITMDAVLINDTEDLDDAEVSFTVGYPNFMFANNISPLYIQQSVNDFLRQLPMGYAGDAQRMGGIMTQSMSNTANYESYSSNMPPPLAPDNNDSVQNLQGTSDEDLYMYKQSHVTLPKGGRGKYTVFTSKIPYEHIYKLEARDTTRTAYMGHSEMSETPENVWHCLRLTNSSANPWTTAPCFIINGLTPVAQETLRYTPPGGKNTIKLTVAVDILAKQEQSEKSRVGIFINNTEHMRIEIAGKIIFTNAKPTKVKINAVKQIDGVILSSDNNAKSTTNIENLNSLNPNSRLEWEFDLEPGQSKELNFTYKTII